MSSYKWFLNDQLITTRNSESLSLNNLKRDHAGNYSCICSNRNGLTIAHFNIDIICKFKLKLILRIFLLKFSTY